MSKKYLVWKNHSTANAKIDWIEMNGFDFYKFIRSPEAKGRYFIRMQNLLEDSSDDTITIEANEAQYREWRTEENHKYHLRRSRKSFITFSYHAWTSDDECYGEEMLPDESVDVQAEVEMIMACEKIAEALLTLSAEERWLIDELFFLNEKMTMRKLSAKTSIPLMTLQDRKKAIYKKIKTFFVQIPKNSAMEY